MACVRVRIKFPKHVVSAEKQCTDDVQIVDDGDLVAGIAVRSYYPVAAATGFCGCETMCAEVDPEAAVYEEDVYGLVYPPSQRVVLICDLPLELNCRQGPRFNLWLSSVSSSAVVGPVATRSVHTIHLSSVPSEAYVSDRLNVSDCEHAEYWFDDGLAGESIMLNDILADVRGKFDGYAAAVDPKYMWTELGAQEMGTLANDVYFRIPYKLWKLRQSQDYQIWMMWTVTPGGRQEGALFLPKLQAYRANRSFFQEMIRIQTEARGFEVIMVGGHKVILNRDLGADYGDSSGTRFTVVVMKRETRALLDLTNVRRYFWQVWTYTISGKGGYWCKQDNFFVPALDIPNVLADFVEVGRFQQ